MGSTPQPNPQIFVKEVQDILLRKNFQNLSDYFTKQNQFLNFAFQELVFTGAVTSQAIPHSLGVIPQDIIVTKITGAGTATFLHGSFTSTNMYISTSGACRIRFFYGTYFNFQSSVNNQTTDQTAYFSTPSAVGKQLLSLVSVPLTSAQLSAGTFGTSTANQYQMQSTDDIVEITLANQASYAVQLQPVSSMFGRVITLVKTSNDFKIITINTAKTADKFSDGTTSTTLATFQERLQLYCDGTTWRVLYRDYPRGMTALVSSTVPALFTNAGTVTLANMFWQRVGNQIRITGSVKAGTTVGATLSFTLPFSLLVDYTQISNNATGASVGTGWFINTGASQVWWTASPAIGFAFVDGTITNQIFFSFTGGTTGFNKTTANNLWLANAPAQFDFMVPIQKWAA